MQTKLEHCTVAAIRTTSRETIRVLHIGEHGGKPQPARIAVEQEQKRVRLGTSEVPTEVAE